MYLVTGVQTCALPIWIFISPTLSFQNDKKFSSDILHPKDIDGKKPQRLSFAKRDRKSVV